MARHSTIFRASISRNDHRGGPRLALRFHLCSTSNLFSREVCSDPSPVGCAEREVGGGAKQRLPKSGDGPSTSKSRMRSPSRLTDSQPPCWPDPKRPPTHLSAPSIYVYLSFAQICTCTGGIKFDFFFAGIRRSS